MANDFEFLTRAKPAAIHKLLERLPMDEAAMVLTGLPQKMVVQILAYYPDELQPEFLPAMRAARAKPPAERSEVAQRVLGILKAARDARSAATAAPTPTPAPTPAPMAPPPPAESLVEPPERARPIALHPADINDLPDLPDPSAPPPPPAGTRPIVRPLSESPLHSATRRERPGPTPKSLASRPNNPYHVPPNASILSGDQPDTHNAPPPPAAPNTPHPTPPPEPASGPTLADSLGNLGDALKGVLKAALGPSPEKTGKTEKAPDPGRRIRSELPPRKETPKRDQPAGPTRWIPRTATASPINGPALPGTPPPIAGDPLKSPLAKAGLLDLIGRAQEKYLPKSGKTGKNGKDANNESTFIPADEVGKTVTPRRLGTVIDPPGPEKTGKTTKPGQRPEPREGMLARGKVEMNNTPRVIGPGMKKRPAAYDDGDGDGLPLAGGARRMDGKAILAAILREAGPEMREQVQDDDPALFRQLRERMFYFDDLIYTEDGALARVFTAAPSDTAALALKFAAPKLRDRVFRVVSPGRARELSDAPARAGLDDIERAQKQVLNVALQLQAAGRILIDPRDPDLIGGI